MSIINSGDVYKIIRKTLTAVNPEIMTHSEIVGYILYKMLQYENKYSAQDLIDYTMIGILHDIGLFRLEDSDMTLLDAETKNIWGHSIYGYQFLRYLSPLEDKAEIVLYHHLDYNKHSLILSPYLEIAEHLNFADKFDLFTRLNPKKRLNARQFFEENTGKVISPKSKTLFLEAEKAFHITKKLLDGSYLTELTELLSLRQFTENYKRAFLEMLIYTIDFRSEYIVLHTLGTTTFALELAKLLRLTKDEAYQLYYGALLHDIGKILVPVEILESPNRLTADEMDIMRLHVNYTEEILKGIVEEPVLMIAIRHHEKLDGSGYPNGLTGNELTRPQRIVAVADILSALYQKRSYKEAFDPEKIISILERERDSGKLCSEIVNCTLKNLPLITSNFEKKKNATISLYLSLKEQHEQIYERFKVFEV